MWPSMQPHGHRAHNTPISKTLGAQNKGFSPDSKHCQPVIQGIEHGTKNTT